MSKKILIPNEIKQKQVVWFHCFGNPITLRNIVFFIPSLVIAYFLGVIYLKFVPYPKDIPYFEKVAETVKRVMILSSIPFFSVLISNWERDGKYLGEKLLLVLKYRNKAGIVFNKKTRNSLNQNK